MSATQSVIVAKDPDHRLGLAVATYYFMLDLGSGVGPVLLGALISQTSYGTMFLTIGIVVLLTLLQYWYVHGKYQQHHDGPR